MGVTGTKPCSIYAIRCDVNGKMYIGQSSNPERRAEIHFTSLRSKQSYSCGSPEFQEDFRKYGPEHFKLYILEENVPIGKRREREAHWIKEYQTTDPQHGYNRCAMTTKPKVTRASGLPPKPGQRDGA